MSCHKCGKVANYDLAQYGRTGEDTFDFQLCHKCEKELWGKFLPETAVFGWEEEE